MFLSNRFPILASSDSMPKASVLLSSDWSLITIYSIDLHFKSAFLFLQILGLTTKFSKVSSTIRFVCPSMHRSKLFPFAVAAFAIDCSPVCLNASPFTAPLYINSCITESIHPHMALCQSQSQSQSQLKSERLVIAIARPPVKLASWL